MNRNEKRAEILKTLAERGVTNEMLAQHDDPEHGVLTVDQLADKILDAADKVLAQREEEGW